MAVSIHQYFEKQEFKDQAYQCQSTGFSGQFFKTHSKKIFDIGMQLQCPCWSVTEKKERDYCYI